MILNNDSVKKIKVTEVRSHKTESFHGRSGVSLTDINCMFVFIVLMGYIETRGYDDCHTMKVIPTFSFFLSVLFSSYFFFFLGGGGEQINHKFSNYCHTATDQFAASGAWQNRKIKKKWYDTQSLLKLDHDWTNHHRLTPHTRRKSGRQEERAAPRAERGRDLERDGGERLQILPATLFVIDYMWCRAINRN